MRIHLVGVGGISMRALARYLVDAGHTVSGCDMNPLTLLRFPDDPNQRAVRRLLGFPIQLGHAADHIQAADRVIINSAITESHPGWVEVLAARAAGIEVVKRAQAIGEITRRRPTIACTGTHGKTTTTGLVAHLLESAQHDPFVMIGARVAAYGGQSYRPGQGPLVLEADEFDRSFLQFAPTTLVLTNIDADHLDYYTGGIDEIISAFSQFLRCVVPGGTLILPADDPHARQAYAQARAGLRRRRVIWYGRRAAQLDYRIEALPTGPQRNRFSVQTEQLRVVIDLAIPGSFNQENATAALAAAVSQGVALPAAAAALAGYAGVDMRFEQLYDDGQRTIISDYGHHPTEVQVTVAAAQAWFPGRPVTLIFQPHQYARTKLLFAEFVAALTAADRVIVTDIYGVAGREDRTAVSAERLVQAVTAHGGTASYQPLPQLLSHLQAVVPQAPGVYLMMGAGLDIRLVAEALADACRHHD